MKIGIIGGIITMANANNTVVLLGKLVNDPIFVTTKEGIEFSARFTLRVDHNYRNKEGLRGADFIPVHLDNKNRMEFAHMLRAKQAIVVTGAIKTESYKDSKGDIVYSMFVAADNISWTYGNQKKDDEKKNEENQENQENASEENAEKSAHTNDVLNDTFSIDIGFLPFS